MTFKSVRRVVEWTILALLIVYTWFTVNFVGALFVLLAAVVPYCLYVPSEMKGVVPSKKEVRERVVFYFFVFIVEQAYKCVTILILGVSDNAGKDSAYRNDACSFVEKERVACSEQHEVIQGVSEYVYESIVGFHAPFGLDLSALQYALIVAFLSNVIAFALLLLFQYFPLKRKGADS